MQLKNKRKREKMEMRSRQIIANYKDERVGSEKYEDKRKREKEDRNI